MIYIGRTNCQHLDNWRHCRVHTLPWWVRWIAPKGRPACVFEVGYNPQDGVVTCPDQLPYPRPPPPQSGSSVKPPPAKDD